VTVTQPSQRVATVPRPAPPEFLQSCHDLLLWLADRLPDDLLCQARRWLADAETTELVRALSFAVVAGRLPVFAEELGFLIEALEACAEYSTSLTDVEPVDVDPGTPFAFLAMALTAAQGLERAGEHVPECLDHTTADGEDDGILDAVDARATATAAGQAGVLGLWRSWRVPAHESPWPAPKRIYLVEVSSRATRHAVTDEIARSLAAAGEIDPLVEVWAVDDAVPEYQTRARVNGALLWAASPPRPVRLAPVFHNPERSGRLIDTWDQPRLTNDVERQCVLDYLAAGAVLLTTDALGEDVVEPRGSLVPMDIRTDGTWIWSDATAYYLRQYLIAPHPDLLAHIRTARCRPAQPDTVALFRAMAVIAQPNTDLTGLVS
jgi:hypothetical protein